MRIGLDSNVLIASVKKMGEKYHQAALELSRRIARADHEAVCSALLLIELPGALASSTTMPLDKIFEVQVSVIERFRVKIMPFEPYIDRTVSLMLEFRDLKTKREIGSADFHYLASSSQERCDFFVSTDERHLLRPECREALSKYVTILAPDEAVRRL